MISDSDKISILAAEREVGMIETTLLYTPISDIAKERCLQSCATIRVGLNAARPLFSMAQIAPVVE
jgi:hypothetical protein